MALGQTKHHYAKNRGVLGLIFTNYITIFLNILCVIGLSSQFVGYALTLDLETNPEQLIAPIKTGNIAIIIGISLFLFFINTSIQTIIYQVLLDFVRDSDSFKDFKFYHFAIEPFKRLKLNTFFNILALYVFKIFFVFIINLGFSFLFMAISKVLSVASPSIMLLLMSTVFPIFMYCMNLYLMIAYIQSDIALADSLNRNKGTDIFRVWLMGFKVIQQQAVNYIIFMILLFKWFIIVPILLGIISVLIPSTTILTFILVSTVVIGFAVLHFYVPYYQLAQVTFYDEIVQSRKIKL